MKSDKLLRCMNFVDDELVEAARNLGQKYEKKPEKKHTTHFSTRGIKVALIAAVITVAAAGSVFAYDYIRNNHIYKTQMNNNATDIFEGYSDYKHMNETVTDGNLSVTLKGYYADEHSIYMNFDVKTVDGSEIYEMNENKVPDEGSDIFNSFKIMIDSEEASIKNISCFDNKSSNYLKINRIDDGSLPSNASILVSYVDETRVFDGNNVQILMKDYETKYTTYDNIGFLYSNVAQMFDGVELADDTAFETVKDKSTNNIKALKQGDMHIAVSSTYADAYVDNAGFYDYIDHDKYDPSKEIITKCFALTIVPGSDEAADAMSNIQFVNMITGSQMGNGCISLLEDGRIQISYSVNGDSYYRDSVGKNSDTTLEYLKTQTIKNVVGEHKYETAYAGQWGFVFDLDKSVNFSKSIDESIVVMSEGEAYVGVDGIEITGTKLLLNLFGDYDLGTKVVGKAEAPVITMKDKTKVQTKTGASYFGTKTDDQGISYNDGAIEITILSIINVDDIAEISWNGVTIYTGE